MKRFSDFTTKDLHTETAYAIRKALYEGVECDHEDDIFQFIENATSYEVAGAIAAGFENLGYKVVTTPAKKKSVKRKA